MAQQPRSMRRWYTSLIALVILIGASMVLPNEYTVSEEAELEMDMDCAYEQVSDFNRWIQWNFENPDQLDSIPNAVFFGEVHSKGHEMWVPYRSDTLSLELTEADGRSIAYELKLIRGKTATRGTISLKEKGSKVKVRWDVTQTIGFRPLMRYMNLFTTVDSGEQEEMKKGLKRLEKLCGA